MQTLEVLTSWLASASQQGRGVVRRGVGPRPERPLELYDIEGCPYCRIVREVMTELDVDVAVFPCPKGGGRFRPLAEAIGGRLKFPLLRDLNTSTVLYESDAIIDYLVRTYGTGRGPSRWQVKWLRTPASYAASALRSGQGLRVRPSRAPGEGLELHAFEASPGARLVRETLCELEVPYLLRQAPRTWLRRATADGRDTTGAAAAVPRLVDPAMAVEIAGAAGIIGHLEQHYAA